MNRDIIKLSAANKPYRPNLVGALTFNPVCSTVPLYKNVAFKNGDTFDYRLLIADFDLF